MKKILLILLALSMFMVSCGGNNKNDATEKDIKEADANQEAVPEIQDGKAPIGEEKKEEETNKEKVDVFDCIDYAVSVDGEDYGYVENIYAKKMLSLICESFVFFKIFT